MKLKKPNFWDYKKPNFIAYLLLPLTIPIIVNNFLINIKKSKSIKNIKSICVGNIYIGGTGKTPLTLKITKIIHELNYKTGIIKKFYSNQFDEQKLLEREYKLYCKSKRETSLNDAVKDGIQVAVFDDGLQDRSISYDLKFICFNNEKWIGNGFLIPSGPLREKINSIYKYDAIFFNGNEENISDYKEIVKKYNPNIKIFESYYSPVNMNKFNIEDKYLIFSGIGNPDSFKKTLSKNNINIVKTINFPDHYKYTLKDINQIKLIAKNLNAKIITTEKDYVKIDTKDNEGIEFLQINIIIKNENELIKFIKSKI